MPLEMALEEGGFTSWEDSAFIHFQHSIKFEGIRCEIYVWAAKLANLGFPILRQHEIVLFKGKDEMFNEKPKISFLT
jgi:hypothetical protein